MLISITFLTLLIFSFAVAPIILNNAVYAVLYFIAVFLLISGILLSLGIEFLAFVYAIVYIGAVAVLFLFVVMLLQIYSQYQSAIKLYWIASLFFVISSITFKIFNILTATFQMPDFISNPDLLVSNSRIPINLECISNVNFSIPTGELYLISNQLYNLFGMLFIETAFILLLALIAVIILTKTTINFNHIKNNVVNSYFTPKAHQSIRAFSTNSLSNNESLLSPIALPNYTLGHIIFQFLYTTLLFFLFSGHNFLLGVIVQCLLLFFICVYYIGFEYKDRFILFWAEVLMAIKTQPNTIKGIYFKLRLLTFGWSISVLNLLFYNIPGYIVWSTSTALGIIFANIMFLTFNYVPKELFILWSICSAGLTSYLYCYFCFWYEKKRPFFYIHIKKIRVLLLVENHPLSQAASRLFGPLSWGTLAAAGSYVLATQSNDDARVRMYSKACDVSVARGEPLPDPGPFLRNNPSIIGEGAVGGNKGILSGGVKWQK